MKTTPMVHKTLTSAPSWTWYQLLTFFIMSSCLVLDETFSITCFNVIKRLCSPYQKLYKSPSDKLPNFCTIIIVDIGDIQSCVTVVSPPAKEFHRYGDLIWNSKTGRRLITSYFRARTHPSTSSTVIWPMSSNSFSIDAIDAWCTKHEHDISIKSEKRKIIFLVIFKKSLQYYFLANERHLTSGKRQLVPKANRLPTSSSLSTAKVQKKKSFSSPLSLSALISFFLCNSFLNIGREEQPGGSRRSAVAVFSENIATFSSAI